VDQGELALNASWWTRKPFYSYGNRNIRYVSRHSFSQH